MNDENAQRFIVVMTIITLGSTVGATLKQPPKAKPQINPERIHRYVFGGFAAMFIAAIIADFDPKLGMVLSGLVAGGAFISYGLPTVESYFEKEQEEQTHKQLKGLKSRTQAIAPQSSPQREVRTV